MTTRKNRPMTRRDFLKLSGLGLTVAGLSPLIPELWWSSGDYGGAGGSHRSSSAHRQRPHPVVVGRAGSPRPGGMGQ